MKRRAFLIAILLCVVGNATSHADVFSSIFGHHQEAQIVPLVGEAVPDTVNADTADSCNAWRESDFTLPAEYAKYLVVEGNGTVSLSKATFAATWNPVHEYADSLYFWIKASIADIDTNGVDVWLAYGDSNVVAEEDSIVVTTADTWQRYAIPITTAITDDVHVLVVKAYCKEDYKVWLSDFYVK